MISPGGLPTQGYPYQLASSFPLPLLVFFGPAAFDVAFILVMPTLPAIPARNCAMEMVLVFYLLTIFSLLLTLKLDEATGSPFIVMGVAGSSFVVRRWTVKKIGNPFAIGERGLLHMLQLPSMSLTRVRLGLRRPPFRIPRTMGFPSEMLAQILIHLGVIFALHG